MASPQKQVLQRRFESVEVAVKPEGWVGGEQDPGAVHQRRVELFLEVPHALGGRAVEVQGVGPLSLDQPADDLPVDQGVRPLMAMRPRGVPPVVILPTLITGTLTRWTLVLP